MCIWSHSMKLHKVPKIGSWKNIYNVPVLFIFIYNSTLIYSSQNIVYSRIVIMIQCIPPNVLSVKVIFFNYYIIFFKTNLLLCDEILYDFFAMDTAIDLLGAGAWWLITDQVHVCFHSTDSPVELQPLNIEFKVSTDCSTVYNRFFTLWTDYCELWWVAYCFGFEYYFVYQFRYPLATVWWLLGN